MTIQVPSISGICAVILWSTCVPIARIVTEHLGSLMAGALIQFVGGIFGIVYFISQRNLLLRFKSQSTKFILWCGVTFSLYFLFLYLAIGLAESREQLIEIGLIQYLWPTFTLLFSLVLLPKKASPLLIIGMLLALSGGYIAITSGAVFSLDAIVVNFQNSPYPYVFAFIAAVFWALYSNLNTLLTAEDGLGVFAFFMLFTGLLLFGSGIFLGEEFILSKVPYFELFYLGTVSTLGYALWEYGMKKGDVTLITVFSYFAPLLYALFGMWYLGVEMEGYIILSCILLIAGAFLSKISITDKNS